MLLKKSTPTVLFQRLGCEERGKFIENHRSLTQLFDNGFEEPLRAHQAKATS